MTKALPFTQASLRRAIRAAQKAGLNVTGIRPDGTLIIGDSAQVRVEGEWPTAQTGTSPEWEDIRA